MSKKGELVEYLCQQYLTLGKLYYTQQIIAQDPETSERRRKESEAEIKSIEKRFDALYKLFNEIAKMETVSEVEEIKERWSKIYKS